jgi:hypothetical protein
MQRWATTGQMGKIQEKLGEKQGRILGLPPEKRSQFSVFERSKSSNPGTA